jgi:tetratricopeptide (TPR) repeat protein
MAKRKKISRKKLLKEPDEFITFSGRMFQFTMEHKTQLTYAVSIVIALIVLLSGYRFFALRSENKALALLDQATEKYQAALQDQDLNAAYRAVSGDFQIILNKYGSKEGGKLAQVMFANICYDAGEYGKAVELYKKSLKNFENYPLIQNLILSGLGYAHEQLNENQLAASYFEQIAASDVQILRDEALFNLGVLYDKLGENEKSAKAFNRIMSDHQDSVYIDMVKERSAG